MRVLYVSTGLATGGAEKQLFRLISHLLGAGVEIGVVSLLSQGEVGKDIAALGVPVRSLDLTTLKHVPQGLVRLRAVVRSFNPHVLQGWMYHGNLVAYFASRHFAPKAQLVWGVRQSLYDLKREKPLTKQVIRLSAWISGAAHAIVYNSMTARVQHEALGFAARCGHIIDNGFDTQVFRPDATARLGVRRELGLLPDSPLIGLVARYHPMKGHEVFLTAAAQLAERRKDAHFLLVGEQAGPQNPILRECLKHPALAGRVHCLGRRDDMPRLTAALDIASSSSWGEAFPNVVGEAMSCGVPVVATDVGDVRRIVGEAGVVVPVGDVAALADAWANLLDHPELRTDMGQKGRQRIIDAFSVEAMGQRYQRLYEEVVHV